MFLNLRDATGKVVVKLNLVGKVASRMKVYARLATRLPWLFRPIDPLTQLNHLPFSIVQSLNLSIANRQASERIKRGYYADRLVFLAALPKSASGVIQESIALMQNGAGIRQAAYLYVSRPYYERDLRVELVHGFPKGGVLKTHSRATTANLFVLNLLKLKYPIMVRHPADHIAAILCMYRGIVALREAPGRHDLRYAAVLAPR